MNVEFAHEDCPHCRRFIEQALTTMETLGFTFIGIGNNLGHSVRIEIPEEEKEETSWAK